VLRGDHDLQEQKLVDATGAAEARPAEAEEVLGALGALPGSLGAVGVTEHRVLVDSSLKDRYNMVTGANEDDWHLVGVDVARDFGDFEWADLRAVRAGEPCVKCGNPLDMWRGIEVGHIFKLGTQYSIAFGATVQDEDGNSHPIVMGSYGIGVERNMAAVVETSHDERGIIWPVSIAPYEVVVTVLRADDGATASAGDDLYRRFQEAGIDVLLDDREERPGVKFADAELIGVPWRVTVGPRGVEAGKAEVTERATMETNEMSLDEVAEVLAERITAAR